MIWDDWRERYDRTSFIEQVHVYDTIAHTDPEQNCFDFDALVPALIGVRTVTEIGGWRGDLASRALEAFPEVARWANYDICQWAVNGGGRCQDRRYFGVALIDWPWLIDLEAADLFVASHVIEHMRLRQFECLADQFDKFGRLHFQIPLPLTGTYDWTGYDGTHIFEGSWEDIERVTSAQGFQEVFRDCNDGCRTYDRLPVGR